MVSLSLQPQRREGGEGEEKEDEQGEKVESELDEAFLLVAG